MTLFDACEKEDYIIEGIFVEEEITRRLEALGFNEGTQIKILTRKKNGAMIIKIRGTRMALGKNISTYIEVREKR